MRILVLLLHQLLQRRPPPKPHLHHRIRHTRRHTPHRSHLDHRHLPVTQQQQQQHSFLSTPSWISSPWTWVIDRPEVLPFLSSSNVSFRQGFTRCARPD